MHLQPVAAPHVREAEEEEANRGGEKQHVEHGGLRTFRRRRSARPVASQMPGVAGAHQGRASGRAHGKSTSPAANSRAQGVAPYPTVESNAHDPWGSRTRVARDREHQPRPGKALIWLASSCRAPLLRLAQSVLVQATMDSFGEDPHRHALASSALVAVERALALVAPHDAPVLLVGETGSGRSVFARRLHQASPRNGGAWMQVDCREISTRSNPVKALDDAIASAATGSILFEEIDLLAGPLQVRLMVRLEASRGALGPRLLATTRRDLEDEVRRGNFREDLRSRVDVFQIRVPPLRERRGEIPALARQLVAESAARLHVVAPFLPLDVEELLVGYPWPGNVRELRNAMERAVALSSGSFIEATSLPPRILAGAASPTTPGLPST